MASVLKVLKFKDNDEHRPGAGISRIDKKNQSTKSAYSVVNPEEITDETLKVWEELPPQVRLDPSWAPFQHESSRRASAVTNRSEQEDDVISNPALLEFERPEEDKRDNFDAMSGRKKLGIFSTKVKIGSLLAFWLIFTICLMITEVKTLAKSQVLLHPNKPTYVPIDDFPAGSRIGFSVSGPFSEEYNPDATDFVFLTVELLIMKQGNLSNVEIFSKKNISETWKIPLLESIDFNRTSEVKKEKVFLLNESILENTHHQNTEIRIRLQNNIGAYIPIIFEYDAAPLNPDHGIVYAVLILIGFFFMVTFEIVDRAFAAIVASTLAIGILSALGQRPSMSEIIDSIHSETILLLFGMMILVAIVSETGIFDFLAVKAYKITNAEVWPLINYICLFSAILASFLNVTAILLMTPITIRLCEILGLNPSTIIIMSAISANVGGTATPIGDLPNVIIASNDYFRKNGINFPIFTLHMIFGVILVAIQVYIQLRFTFKDNKSLQSKVPEQIGQLRREMSVWRRAWAAIPDYSKEGAVIQKNLTKRVLKMSKQLEYMHNTGKLPKETYRHSLDELEGKYPIKDKKLLLKSFITLAFCLVFFFLHGIPELSRLSLGWIAILGAILLLILSDEHDLEHVLVKVEWSVLVYFCAIYVLMESLTKLGLIAWIGSWIEGLILSHNQSARLTVAILLIMWISAISSAIVDNSAFTAMMIKVIVGLVENKELGLPLHPLVWALCFGACLGGNGSLIGAPTNVVCAGVAEKHGYKFTFGQYFRIGFPITIGSMIVATAYLMLCHVAFSWH